MDFVPARSNVACVLQCGGLWFGGKGWGITWKLNQCVVKPHVQETVFGQCHIQLTNEDIQSIETQPVQLAEDEEVEPVSRVAAAASTEVADSDDDAEPEPEPVAVVKKKIVKKAPEPEVVAAPEPEVPKKKVIKKKL
jgi:hypothetical protein